MARYTVTESLARRRFRGVAELRDGTRRDVVIKEVLRRVPSNPRFVETFLDDLRPVRALIHPNIVEILDIGLTAQGECYAVEAYVDGCDLKSLATDTMAIKHACHVVIECSKALAYARGHELVHRDVSPRAIQISTSGEVKLADFGFAKATSQSEDTAPGVVKGRFGYLSPEAARGDDLDHRTDVFALGIVLWEMLSGRRLFMGDTDYQTVELVRAAYVPAVRSIEPALDIIVRTALARDANARYQRAADLGAALQHHALDRGIVLSPRDLGQLAGAVTHEQRLDPLAALVLAKVEQDANRMQSIFDR